MRTPQTDYTPKNEITETQTEERNLFIKASQSISTYIREIRESHSSQNRAKNKGLLTYFGSRGSMDESILNNICIKFNQLVIEDIISALILFLKFIDKTGINLNDNTASIRLFFTALFVAKKAHNDNYFSIKDFTKIIGLQEHELPKLEQIFIAALDWNFFIDQATYIQMHTQLTSTAPVYPDLFGTSAGPMTQAPRKTPSQVIDTLDDAIIQDLREALSQVIVRDIIDDAMNREPIKALSHAIVKDIVQIKKTQGIRINTGNLANFRLGNGINESLIERICVAITELTPEDILATYILFSRFIEKTAINLNDGNTSISLFITAMFVAKKAFTDRFYAAQAFASMFKLKKETIIQLEKIFIQELDWTFFIDQTSYTQMHTRLTNYAPTYPRLFNTSKGPMTQDPRKASTNNPDSTNTHEIPADLAVLPTQSAAS